MNLTTETDSIAEWIRLVTEAPLRLQDADFRIRDAKRVVMAAIGQWGGAVESASDRLRSDPEVAYEAVKGYGWALKWLDPGFRDSDFLVRIAVQDDGEALEWASPRLRADPEVVRIALSADPDPDVRDLILDWADSEIRAGIRSDPFYLDRMIPVHPYGSPAWILANLANRRIRFEWEGVPPESRIPQTALDLLHSMVMRETRYGMDNYTVGVEMDGALPAIAAHFFPNEPDPDPEWGGILPLLKRVWNGLIESGAQPHWDRLPFETLFYDMRVQRWWIESYMAWFEAGARPGAGLQPFPFPPIHWVPSPGSAVSGLLYRIKDWDPENMEDPDFYQWAANGCRSAIHAVDSASRVF